MNCTYCDEELNSHSGVSDGEDFDCPNCGEFTVSRTALKKVLTACQKAVISHFIWVHQSDTQPLYIDTSVLKPILDEASLPSLSKKIENLKLYLYSAENSPGIILDVIYTLLRAKVGVMSKEEIPPLLRHLEEEGLIRNFGHLTGAAVQWTVLGITDVEMLLEKKGQRNKATEVDQVEEAEDESVESLHSASVSPKEREAEDANRSNPSASAIQTMLDKAKRHPLIIVILVVGAIIAYVSDIFSGAENLAARFASLTDSEPFIINGRLVVTGGPQAPKNTIVRVFWLIEDVDEKSYVQSPEHFALNDTSRELRYELRLIRKPPPEALNHEFGLRIAYGAVAAFDDSDGNRLYTEDRERIVGIILSHAIVYIEGELDYSLLVEEKGVEAKSIKAQIEKLPRGFFSCGNRSNSVGGINPENVGSIEGLFDADLSAVDQSLGFYDYFVNRRLVPTEINEE